MNDKSEIELLLLCLREEEPGIKKERLRGVADNQWEVVCQAACDFGLAPLLYSTLRPLIKDIGLPAGAERRLREIYLNSAARNMRLYSELSKVLRSLKGADIPVIPLKGAYLAEVIYGDTALRPMNDIDLMVRQEDFRKTIELLTNKGYRAEGNAKPEDVFSVQQHYPPLTSRNGFSIEVHWTLIQPKLNGLIMPPHPPLSREGRGETNWLSPCMLHPVFSREGRGRFPCYRSYNGHSALSRVGRGNNVIPQHAAGRHWIAEGIWHRTKPGVVANVEILVLSPEDFIIHLCIHAALHHGLVGQLRSLFDIARTVRCYKDEISWPLMCDLTRSCGAERSVYLAMTLAARHAGLSVPEDPLATIRPEGNMPGIVPIAESFLFNRSRILLSRHVAGLWEQQGLFNKFRYLLKRFFLPTAQIAVSYGVPSNSIKVYFYYLMRWRDIFRRHLRNIVRALLLEQAISADLEVSIKENALLRWLSNEKGW